MINTYSLFPVIVYQGKLPLQPFLHKKIISFVEKNYTEKNMYSIVNGVQIHEDFDGKKELDQLLNKLTLTTLSSSIVNGWLNILGNDSYNHPHIHPSNEPALSGVLYISNTNNNINFTKDGDVFSFQPKIFDYLIFPYNLVHYVLPEKRKEKRISYAFNLKIERVNKNV